MTQPNMLDEKGIKKFADPMWRLQNLYKIRTKFGTVVNLKPNRSQQEFLKNEGQYNIILKARQLGMSTLCLIRMLDYALFTPNVTCVVIAHERESTQKLFKIIKFAYDNYPKGYPKADAKYDTRNELGFSEIGSSIYVATKVRGDTINMLHLSEMAFMEDPEGKFLATASAVTPNGKITIESTANGVGDYFYDFWNQADERNFTKHFFPWFNAKEYRKPAIGIEFDRDELELKKRFGLDSEQLAWRKEKVALHGRDGFLQEYPATAEEAFIAAGGNVFPLDIINNIETKEPLIDAGGMKVWGHPVYSHSYAMGVDVSEGIGKDESAIDIIDLDTGEQVWHWSGNCSVQELAEKVELYSHKYNRALIIPEANNHGYSLIYLLQDKKLRIYKREKFDGPKVKQIDRLGWQTTRRTKPLMIQALTTALYEDDIKIYNKKTIDQMRTFLNDRETGKMEAAPGKRDDCVISLCLAWQGIRKGIFKKQQPINTFDFSTSSKNMISY